MGELKLFDMYTTSGHSALVEFMVALWWEEDDDQGCDGVGAVFWTAMFGSYGGRYLSRTAYV